MPKRAARSERANPYGPFGTGNNIPPGSTSGLPIATPPTVNVIQIPIAKLTPGSGTGTSGDASIVDPPGSAGGNSGPTGQY